jgi:hypothetical protein
MGEAFTAFIIPDFYAKISDILIKQVLRQGLSSFLRL